ncbi:MAG: MFS transporter [Candidatus Latescibacterota bacterium]|nr:MFS transporter [Candidatus Latescibacterota bacterium]
MTDDSPPNLSRGQSNRAMHSFVVASGLWGAWGQAVGFGTTAFTGFILHVGGDESLVALFTSLAYLLTLTQLLSPFLSSKVHEHKRIIIGFGFIEILFRCAPILIYFVLPESLRLVAMVGAIIISLFCGNLVGPIYNTWISRAVPEAIRARYTGKQTIISTVVAMLSGFAIGQFLDLSSEDSRIWAFAWVFLLGTIFGLLGYFSLLRAPFPLGSKTDSETAHISDLIIPFKNIKFVLAILFFGFWTFGQGLAGPLYSVFMLDRLKISYTEISIFNGLFMATSILGYRVWSVLIDRFGSKAVLQLLIIPASAIPILWIFNEPGHYFLVPVALVLSGIFYSGIGIGVNPLLFQLLPQGPKRTVYLAAWSVAVNLMGALGTLVGSFLSSRLIDFSILIFGFPIGNLQVLFGLSSICCFISFILLQRVQDSKHIRSRELLSQMRRGNVLSYAYNATIFNIAHGERTRARAAEALGRSGNPLAIEQLVEALADASPLVRRSAATALGESGVDGALNPLLRELSDGSSDIRGEAAEALGRLGHHSSIDPLVEALSDSDLRVRISAIRGLGNISGEETHELLYWHFTSEFDPLTFPTLVGVLSTRKDQRIVKPTLAKIAAFQSPAIRLQLLNSICRAIGAGNKFYRLLSEEDTERISSITHLIDETRDQLEEANAIEKTFRSELTNACNNLRIAYEQENIEEMCQITKEITRDVRDSLSGKANKAYEVLSVYMIIVALNTFLNDCQTTIKTRAPREVFIVVCLFRLTKLMQQIEH